MLTRREFGTMAVAGLALPRLASGFDSTVNGVHIGVQTYSYRDLPRPAGAADSVDVVINAMKVGGLTECELFSPQLEPQFAAGARGQRGAPPSPAAGKGGGELRKRGAESPLGLFKKKRPQIRARRLT